MSATHPHFVPNGESRRDTAVLLVGTAREFGIDQRSIRSSYGGFWITDEVKEALTGVFDKEDADMASLSLMTPGQSDEQAEDDVLDAEAPEGREIEPDEDDDEILDEDDDDLILDDEDASYDPADDNIPGVKAWVKDNPEHTEAVLELERQGENRSSLISWLTEQISQ